MSTKNTNSFLEWLKTHSYALIVAFLLIVGDWAVIEYRMNDFEKDLQSLELKVEDNRAEIEKINIQRAKDIAEIRTILLSIDEKLDRSQRKFDEYDANIRKFYETYDLKPKGN